MNIIKSKKNEVYKNKKKGKIQGFLFFVESKITSCPGGSMVEH